MPSDDVRAVRATVSERRHVRHLVGALGALLAAGLVGSAFAPVLAVNAPLLLIVLSPLGRHLVLVAPVTSMPAFVAVAATRRLLGFSLLFFLARAYGEDGFVWIEARHPRTGRFTRHFERVFRRAAPVFVLLLPGTSAPVAGATHMPFRAYLPLATIGTTAWVGVAYLVGDALRAWTTPVLAFIRANMVETTAVCVVAVTLYELWRRRRSTSTR